MPVAQVLVVASPSEGYSSCRLLYKLAGFNVHACARRCWSWRTLGKGLLCAACSTSWEPHVHACNAQVLVVANPANTNALILKENAPSIPAENITCLTRLDHNRALGQVRSLHAVHLPYPDTPSLCS